MRSEGPLKRLMADRELLVVIAIAAFAILFVLYR